MCGRYASSKAPSELAAEFDARDETGSRAPEPDYNVAPTKPVFSIVQRHPRDAEGSPDPDRSERTVRVMRWGLVPKWAKDPSVGSRMINARSETVATKPAFRGAVRYYRCLLPADGWYEWKRDSSPKQPYYVTNPDDSSLGMAGIWATWRDPAEPEAEPLVSCAVLTTEAVGELAEVHERMPLVLASRDWAEWLDPDNQDVTDLLVPPSGELVERLRMRPVSRAVNSVANNSPGLTEPVPEKDALFGS
ncbi:putative SOS response-associated peptidase YedK [Actinopolyspora lacussalsi]|uniref:Abasic site processing protein n=1 Tax=Actinopolyspora righensis TaxID=995060 RepID=A0A1I7CE56_9ACTN|nr:SOS response-associated peptidase [Actinopolyspora righensis]MDP9644237.1 putative SOS response-associated peptidase YedK [Actinopolyspora lacussalsi]SFT97693.1 Putative SOS response-associated peptidase YedK [Actinopolyspora righensis]